MPKIELGICATRVGLIDRYEFARVGIGLEEEAAEAAFSRIT